VTSIERPTTLTALVAERLRADILSEKLGPGQHLRQNDVANAYGVSSTPVREALAVLERDGLVVVHPHRGATIVEPTIEDLRELYEIRTRLECFAIELACANPAPDLGPIRAPLDQMAELDPEDRATYIALNSTFHEQMYALANRPRLERLITDLRDASAVYLTLLVEFTSDPAQSQRDHEAIFAGLSERDARRASSALAAHLNHTVEQAELLFERQADDNPHAS